MHELSVFYCPKCGRYGYYQRHRNAVCAQCGFRMRRLPISYAGFLRLDHSARDRLITEEILRSGPLISGRILAADHAHDSRRSFAELTSRIRELEEENRKLNETISWMHQTIWELLAKSKQEKAREDSRENTG